MHLHHTPLLTRPLRISTTLATILLTTLTIPTHHVHHRLFSSLPPHQKQLPLPPRPTLSPDSLKSSYLKGSGPGGQKINKTSSAVQLTHLPTGLVVKSQATRSQKQNFNIAKRLLAEKVEFIERGEESRVVKRGEMLRERKGRSGKKTRRKYRKLEEAKMMKGLEGEGEGENVEGEAGGLMGDGNGNGIGGEEKEVVEKKE